MEIRYLGHSCIEVKTDDVTLLFDPFISPNPLAKAIDIQSLNPDYILLSHGHEDHIADAFAIASNNKATIVSNFEIVSWYQEKGLENVHSMNLGGKKEFSFGSVKMVNAVHTSMLPDGSNGGNPAGFVVKCNNGKSLYFAGDTALTYDMNLIGAAFKIDLAVLPVGDNYTMGYEDALVAADFVKCDRILAVHYDSFPAIEIDKNAAIKAAKNANKTIEFLPIGNSIKL